MEIMELHTFIDIHPFSWRAIATALFCGSLIGLERQLRGKPVGMRTSSLIVFGTYLFISSSFAVSNDMTDPSRIIGQVVTGIGFLGAGVMMAKEGLIVGATSAATIWALAAIGVCIASVGEIVAIKMAFVVVIILYGIDSFEEASSFAGRKVQTRFNQWRSAAQKKRWDEPD